MLARVCVGRQLGALARLEDGEDDGADEGADELRHRLVDVQDAKVDARELPRAPAAGGVVVRPVLDDVDGVRRRRVGGPCPLHLDAVRGAGETAV